MVLWTWALPVSAPARDPVLTFADGQITCTLLPIEGENVPEKVQQALPIAMRTALDLLGPPPKPTDLTIRLQPRPRWRQRALQGFPVEALATQQGNVIVLRPGSEPLNVAFRLGHELSHWLVYKQYPARPPLWLDEGLANWIGSAAADAMGRTLKQAVARPLPPNLSNHLVDLEELIAMEVYPRSRDRSAAFYWQAEALVSALIQKLGPEHFKTYLGILSVAEPPHWETPLREQWYFIDFDFTWFAQQIRPADGTPSSP